ncbi:MAG: hypothetical protein PF588_03000 [Candidatus Kapabacteria bacterium]|jgi:hypothetical protein|nr:hypothetical protein [Candidatus Kapabacteria bacterium]
MDDPLIPDDIVEISTEMLHKFLRLARGINGSGFLQYASADKNNVLVKYFSSYADYKRANPDSAARPKAFDYYFADRADAEMLIVREPMKIMTALPMVQSVVLYAPVDSTYMKVDIDRETAAKYFDIDFMEMSLNDNKWRKFVDKNIIDSSKRNAFLSRFAAESGDNTE